MTQDHVLSNQKKNPHVLDMGLPPFSAFKVCHLVSKNVYYQTANPKAVKVPSFKLKVGFQVQV